MLNTVQTHYGPTQGPEVEIWLPRPTTVSSFGEVKEHITSQAEKAINAKQPIVVESTLDDLQDTGLSSSWASAGLSYYGPQPLMKALETLSLAQLMSEGSRERKRSGRGAGRSLKCFHLFPLNRAVTALASIVSPTGSLPAFTSGADYGARELAARGSRAFDLHHHHDVREPVAGPAAKPGHGPVAEEGADS